VSASPGALTLTNPATLEVSEVNENELTQRSIELENEIAARIVTTLPPSERHNLVKRLAHRFGWEVAESDLYAAARELGIDLNAS